MKNYTLLFLVIAFSLSGFGQDAIRKVLSIGGKITDESGVGISGVSITVKGSSSATASSIQGFYFIKNIYDGDSVMFTHVAYQTATFQVKGNNLINVEMRKASHRLWNFKIIDTVQTKINNVQNVEKEKYVFEKVEIMPYFKGGETSLYKYLGSVIKYPEIAKKGNIEGEVIVGFIVGMQGEIKDVKIVTGISPECDQIALSAIKDMPNWIGGIQNGRKIEVYIELSVSFSLISGN